MKQLSRKILVIVVLHILTVVVYAGQQSYFHQLTSLEGLSSNNIYSILQDKSGFLWFGTANGVSRYDGYVFENIKTVYSSKDTFQISIVRDLYEDSSGVIWICTEKTGLIEYQKNSKQFSHSNHDNSPLRQNKVYTILQDDNSLYWVGTSLGLNIFRRTGDVKEWLVDSIIIGLPDELKSQGVKSIFKDAQGLIWIGTLKDRVFSFLWNGSKYVKKHDFNMAEILSHDMLRGVNAITQTSDGILWFAFWGAPICNYDKSTKEIYNYFERNSIDGFDATVVTDFAINKNEIYFSTWKNGLYRLNLVNKQINNWKHNSYNPYGLGKNELRTVVLDRDDNVYVGTSSESGVNILSNTSLNFNISQLNVIDKNVDIIAQNFEIDSAGNFYTITKSGVYVHNIKEENQQDELLPIILNSGESMDINAYTLEYDHNLKCLWIGTEGQSLMKYDLKTKQAKQYDVSLDLERADKLCSNVVMDLFLEDTLLWIGTWSGGMSVLNTKTELFRHYHVEESHYSNDIIIDIEPENDSTLWLATFGKGIHLYNKNTNKSKVFFDQPDGKYMGGGTFLQLKKSSDGMLWAGTLNNGVIRFDYSKNLYDVVGGEEKNTITSASVFEEDENGNMWIGCNNGILCVNPSLNVTVYSRSNGIINNSYPAGASFKFDNGTCWFGGNKNIVSFKPEHIRSITKEYVPVITNIVIEENTKLGKQIISSQALLKKSPEFIKTLELKHNQNSLMFEFSAMNFTNPAAVRFKYKLEGFDGNWKETSASNRTAFFTNLPAGDYTFKLFAACENSDWNQEPVCVSISIKKPIWLQWWFYLFELGLIAVIIYLFIKVRTRKLERNQNKLEEMIRLRTEQITQQSEEIVMQRDSIISQKEKIERAHKDTTDSIEYARRIQEAMLPSKSALKRAFQKSFIFYRPLNIVSGDFYWIHEDEQQGIKAIAVGDCTGHGVPGAFLSILGISLLNDIVSSLPKITAASILNVLRKQVKVSLKQTGKVISAKDGMDMSLCIINEQQRTINYAGAYNQIYIVDIDGAMTEYKADKMPIGYHLSEKEFTDIQLSYNEGAMLYMFTDGFYDQFGGEYGKKMKTKKFKDILKQIHHLHPEEQKEKLKEIFQSWINPGSISKYSQLDDIIVVGIRLG